MNRTRSQLTTKGFEDTHSNLDLERGHLLQNVATKPIEKEKKALRVLQIYVQGSNIKNFDGNRDKTDSQVTLNMKWKTNQTTWTEVDRTEVVPDDLDPKYVHHFDVIFNLGQIVQLQFVMHDIDANTKQFIGLCEISLADLVTKASYRGYSMDLLDLNKGVAGKLILLVHETFKSTTNVTLKLQAQSLPSKTNILKFNFSTTYFLEIYRGPRGNNAKIYESEWFVNQPDHEFDPIELTDAFLCELDPFMPIEFKFINRNQFQMINTEVCYLETTFKDLLETSLKKDKSALLTNVEGKKKSYLKIKNIIEDPIPAFGDFIKNGYKMSLIGAIDFTYSNGDSSNPLSLHYIDKKNQHKNQYLRCLKAVTSILDQYDHDRVYPFFGFGGVPEFMGEDEVSHCFPLNGNWDDPSIEGVQNLIKTYTKNLPYIQMAGPTRFAPILSVCKSIVDACEDEKVYHIILIITDGEIHDMRETVEEIAEMALENMPVSIVIVGVGNEDFSSMVRLDGDDLAIKENVKDIVQFVKFEEVMRNSEKGMADQNLASQIFEEIPAQMINCFIKRGDRVQQL